MLDEIPKHTSVLEAAKKLNVSEANAYATLYRIRRKVERADEFLKIIQSLRRREPKLTKLLTPKG